MEAILSDPSVSSVVLPSPVRFSDHRASVRDHTAENKKGQPSVRHLPIAPHNVDQRSPYQQKKNPSHKALFSLLMGRSSVRVSTIPAASGFSGSFCPTEGWKSTVELWNVKIRCFCPRCGIIFTECLYFLCDLHRTIIVHLDYMIRNIEESIRNCLPPESWKHRPFRTGPLHAPEMV